MALGLRAGDTVITMRDIGGFARPFVARGTVGVVTFSNWGRTEVLFTVRGWLRNRNVFVTVYAGEVQLY